MNDIPQKQNEQRQLQILLAQRRFYSKAKVYFTWRISVALSLAIVGPLVTALNNNLNVYVGMAAIAYLLIDILLLERVESGKKMNGAKLQELFDTQLFEIPWNEYVAGKKPDDEIIAEVLNLDAGEDFKDLENWYPIDVGKVDLPLARFICQRSNVWWDTSLRRWYVALLIAILTIIVGGVAVFSVIVDLSVAKVIVGIILPVLPLFEVILKQIKENLESARATFILKENIDCEIEKCVTNTQSPNPENVTRVFQDQMFRHRNKCPMVFDWVHCLLKQKHENQMQFSAKTKVEEYMARPR